MYGFVVALALTVCGMGKPVAHAETEVEAGVLPHGPYAEQRIVLSDVFTVRLWGDRFAVEHRDYRPLLWPSAVSPVIEPVAVRETWKHHHITHRLRPRMKARRFSYSPFVVSYAVPGRVQLTQSVKGRHCQGYIEVVMEAVSERSVEMSVSTDMRHHDHRHHCRGLRLSFMRTAGEKLRGLGTQYSLLDLTGHRFVTLSQEQGHGRGLQPLTWLSNHIGPGTGGDETTSYHYVPHVITSHFRSFWLDTIRHAQFDFRDPEEIRIITHHPQFTLRMNVASSVKELLWIFAQAFGVTKKLPAWVHRGAMLGIQGGQDKVQSTLDRLLKEAAAISSLWIQDWTGSIRTFIGQRLRWHWRLDRVLYPKWEEMVGEYLRRGIRTLTYFNPRFTSSSCEEYRPCYFDVAQRRGHLVRDLQGRTVMLKNGGFDYAKLDLSSPAARDWFGAVIRRHYRSTGVSGWMADFSESLPARAYIPQFSISGQEYHNQYILEWTKLNGRLIDEVEDGFVFMRTGVLGSHRHIHGFWLGDQLTTWDRFDGLHSTIIGLITSGLSGALVNHSDIGGLTSLRIPLVAHIRRTKELFLRWMQMNAFTPIFRTHEGLWPWDSHHFDSDQHTWQQFVRYSRIFAALFPYRLQLVQDTQSRGLPMVRAMFVEFPHVSRMWDVDDQFMLGADVIVAPSIAPDTTKRDVYLPSGRWLEVFSGDLYELSSPRYVNVMVGEDEIPVFARADSEVGTQLRAAILAEQER